MDFALNVRRTPFSLERMREEDPALHAAFLDATAAISRIRPLSEATLDVLRRYFHGFEASQVEIQLITNQSQTMPHCRKLDIPDAQGLRMLGRECVTSVILAQRRDANRLIHANFLWECD